MSVEQILVRDEETNHFFLSFFINQNIIGISLIWFRGNLSACVVPYLQFLSTIPKLTLWLKCRDRKQIIFVLFAAQRII